MKRHTAVLLSVPVAFLIAGCSEVEDAASNIANDVASEVAGAAAAEVQRQICNLVEDGLVSMEDQQVLSGLVDAAEAAGVPAEITTPLEDIAAAGDEVPAESATALREACAPAEN